MELPSWMSDMFPEISGNQKGMHGSLTEFTGGHDRVKKKSLDKRLIKNETVYRKSMPSPMQGAAPGLESQTSKVNPGDESDGSLPGTARGVNFFGYGNDVKINPFGAKINEVSTNPHAVDKVKISGFTTFKAPMSDSDYGKGVPGAAAEASFYRNRITTDRYGEMYNSPTIGNEVSYSQNKNIVASGGIPPHRQGERDQSIFKGDQAGDSVEKRNKSFNQPPSGKAPDNGIPQPGRKAQADPLGQIFRKLPSQETYGDLWLNRYLQINTEGGSGSTLYAPKGELPEGGGLPYSPSITGAWRRYEEEVNDLKTGGITENDGSGNPVDKNLNKLSQTQNSTQSSALQATGINKLDRTSSTSRVETELGKGNLSHLIVGHSDPSRQYKKSFVSRKDYIHAPPTTQSEFSANPKTRRKNTLSDENAKPRVSYDNKSAEQQSDGNFGDKKPDQDRTISERIKKRYQPEGLVTDLTPPQVTSNSDAPVNITIQKLSEFQPETAETGRSKANYDNFKNSYDDSLNNRTGTSTEKKNYNAHKTHTSLIDALADSKYPNSKSSDDIKYENAFKDTPYYVHKRKKLPDYSSRANQTVSKNEDAFRIDNFNKKTILDSSKHSDNVMPEWANDDFVPLFFHDLVNKKYIPFRSYINSVSDQATAEWSGTRYLGRADQVQIYTGFARTMSIEFNVVAFSIDELHPMWQRINYMVGLTKPAKYTEDGFVVPPMVKFNLGDIYRNQPVIITSVDTSIPQEATWELLNNERSNGEVGKETYEFSNGDIKKDSVKVARYPTMCTLSVSMSVLEKEIPETIQNHFGTTKKISETMQDTAYGTFNYDLTAYGD